MRTNLVLSLLGTETKYHRQGIGLAFVHWGCDLADKQDKEVYIDASEDGGPFYQKHFGCIPRKTINVPAKPEGFGKLSSTVKLRTINADYVTGEIRYLSHVRPRKSERLTNLGKNGFVDGERLL